MAVIDEHSAAALNNDTEDSVDSYRWNPSVTETPPPRRPQRSPVLQVMPPIS